MGTKKTVKKKKNKKMLANDSVEIFGGVPRDLYDKLTSARFELSGKTYEVNLGGELLFDEDDLHSQVEKLPAIMGYFGSVIAQIKKELDDKKALRVKIESRIDRKLRENGVVGEARIDRMIKLNPKWMEAVLEVNKVSSEYLRARNLHRALIEKGISNSVRSSDLRSIPSDSIMSKGSSGGSEDDLDDEE